MMAIDLTELFNVLERETFFNRISVTAEGIVAHSTSPKSKIKRPWNQYMVFKKNFSEIIKNTNLPWKGNMKSVTKVSSIIWKSASKEEKEKFLVIANEARLLHKVKHPDFFYAPTNRKLQETFIHYNGPSSSSSPNTNSESEQQNDNTSSVQEEEEEEQEQQPIQSPFNDEPPTQPPFNDEPPIQPPFNDEPPIQPPSIPQPIPEPVLVEPPRFILGISQKEFVEGFRLGEINTYPYNPYNPYNIPIHNNNINEPQIYEVFSRELYYPELENLYPSYLYPPNFCSDS